MYIYSHRLGICNQCTTTKPNWTNEAAIAASYKRGWVYQCVANHVNPYKFLPVPPGKPADYWTSRPAPKCPHCHKVIDDKLEQAEQQEWDAATF